MLQVVTRFVGRVLFAFLFVSSGLSKTQGLFVNTTAMVSLLQPRIIKFVETFMTFLHLKEVDQPEVTPAIATYLLYATIFLELVGGVCFIFFPRAGSGLLALYLLCVTPIMHDFYNHAPGSQAYVAEMIHFLKNVALLGATFFVMGTPPPQKREKKLKAS
ncbi:hypothetical protein HOP50_06g44410 [Chloropicon primus]|uniref:Uncharacterized protein n=1 Tax=Chloropicon primus TaxID=1764295 RepID=A0A5B8MN52_9CHLO|nr:hypothetical protein A3770_06p44170 [Chloropicon primus]UPR01120.1 hypothetical protein HOP50_06g44410 [Chloropicon primus]|mmetsp:Transcript_14421/g.41022  ORF Transcript_14421/g.41022 Transcript_14421/m.41022 type:complete len:160 (-) Transcript_14421:52-531(-)|eukprot:QDZ21899.1 hypothetical protein A3770_06p44170 [Chloropicon primus]